MWNPFKKSTNKNQSDDSSTDKDKKEEQALPKMSMLQRLAMKRLEKMDPREREKMMAEAFKPENKEKMLAVMESMRKSGQITEEQYNMAKQKLGL